MFLDINRIFLKYGNYCENDNLLLYQTTKLWTPPNRKDLHTTNSHTFGLVFNMVKTLWEKENMLVTRIFYFCYKSSKGFFLRPVKTWNNVWKRCGQASTKLHWVSAILS